MGERHQIYVKLPAKHYNDLATSTGVKSNPNNRPARTIGIHHQWLYGKTAILHLAQFVKFYKAGDEYSPFKGSIDDKTPVEVLNTIYSFYAEEGYWHRTCTLEDGECDDPMRGDNNCGITIVDLEEVGSFKYCFMSLDGLEVAEYEPPTFTPLTAKQYLDAYYPKLLSDGIFDERHDPDPETQMAMNRFISFIDANTIVLTSKRIREIFPQCAELKKRKKALEIEV